MRFEQYLDFTLFVRRQLPHLVDESLASALAASAFPVVVDELFYLLDDTPSAYFGELRLHSSKKPFYKKLLSETYNDEHLAPLCSLNTHFAISYSNRLRARNNVDKKQFLALKGRVNSVVNKIVEQGSSGSETIRPFLS